jgi:uncharacterized protein YegL
MSTSDKGRLGELANAASKNVLKIYWLVDVSGSMIGDKIATVNRAIKACIDPLNDEAENHNQVQMYVRAMKFSCGAQWHTGETQIEDFKWYDLAADGITDTGAALRLMAQELTEEKMSKRTIPPVIILMSDGEATDDYEGGINEVLAQYWGKKSVRIAIAIGHDANISELSKFCSNPQEAPPLVADKASDLVKYIKWASVTVSKSVSRARIPDDDSNANVHLPPLPQKQVTICGSDDSDDLLFD